MYGVWARASRGKVLDRRGARAEERQRVEWDVKRSRFPTFQEVRDERDALATQVRLLRKALDDLLNAPKNPLYDRKHCLHDKDTSCWGEKLT